MQSPSESIVSFIFLSYIQRIVKRSEDSEDVLKDMGKEICLKLLEILDYEPPNKTDIVVVLQSLTFEFLPELYYAEGRKIEKAMKNIEELKKKDDEKIIENEVDGDSRKNIMSDLINLSIKRKAKESEFILHESKGPFSNFLHSKTTFCGDSIIAGVIEGFLFACGYKSEVTAYNVKSEIAFEKTVYIIKILEEETLNIII